MKQICSKCGQEKEIACLVDGKPWCEDCLDSNLRLIDGRTGKEVNLSSNITCEGNTVRILTPHGVWAMTRSQCKMLVNQILSALGEI